ncbi:CRISPR-associated endonuclease Cas2 [Candidatus Micrarchaeota archaeon]|nr:CRISPR-associated endonuclease Cas2 [Candidatus Micrarchaeota archaeon]
MYVVIAYDISIERVNKVKGYLRTQLTWVQNSLFEGELTNSRFLEVKSRLAEFVQSPDDSIIIYILSDKRFVSREVMGMKKGSPEDTIL